MESPLRGVSGQDGQVSIPRAGVFARASMCGGGREHSVPRPVTLGPVMVAGEMRLWVAESTRPALQPVRWSMRAKANNV